MRIVKQYDPRVKITYVYEVTEAHYDPEKKQSRSTRKLIGKLGPDGEIIPTGAKGRPKGSTSGNKPKADSGEKQHYEDLLQKKDEKIQELEQRIAGLTATLQTMEKKLTRFQEAAKSTEAMWRKLNETV